MEMGDAGGCSSEVVVETMTGMLTCGGSEDGFPVTEM
jgi:hypothetical protein